MYLTNKKIFGTDGVRGLVGSEAMNETFVRHLAYAIGAYMAKHALPEKNNIVIGHDTRDSGKLFAAILIKSLLKWGISANYLGIASTPAIAFYANREDSVFLGVAITASHNPASYNGFKLFNNKGEKFSLEEESHIEAFIQESFQKNTTFEQAEKTHLPNPDLHTLNAYHKAITQSIPPGLLKGQKVVLDMAHGATITSASEVFRHFGADMVLLGNKPNGQNINLAVGSEYPQSLRECFLASEAHWGIAYDGDGDRLIVCDEQGNVLSGEEVLAILALHEYKSGSLPNNLFVTTEQSNMGLDAALMKNKIKTIRSKVGDRMVFQAMKTNGANFGGESSGHVIFPEFIPTGDALFATVKLINVVLQSKTPLKELRKQITLFPQASQSLRVENKLPLKNCYHLAETQLKIQEELSDKGRVLIRYSGTEPKLRLLVEAHDQEVVNQLLISLANAAKKDLKIYA